MTKKGGGWRRASDGIEGGTEGTEIGGETGELEGLDAQWEGSLDLVEAKEGAEEGSEVEGKSVALFH